MMQQEGNVPKRNKNKSVISCTVFHNSNQSVALYCYSDQQKLNVTDYFIFFAEAHENLSKMLVLVLGDLKFM